MKQCQGIDHMLISLKGVEKVKVEQGVTVAVPQQMTTNYILILHIAGEGELVLDDMQLDMQGQGVYWCLPQTTFGMISNAATTMEFMIFRFQLYREPEEESSSSKRLISVTNDQSQSWIEALGKMPLCLETATIKKAHHIWDAWNRQEGGSWFRSQIEFQDMLYFLVMKRQEDFPADSWHSLQQSKEYMERHYNKKISIPILADIAGISDKYYVDLFKKRYQISAMDYLTSLRIQKAKQLMLQSKMKLKDIANQVGFQDEFYFSRKFKKEVGISPSSYMKQRAIKVAAFSTYITGQLIALGVVPYAAPIHPKWAGYYYRQFRGEIPVHLSAFKQIEDLEINTSLLEQAQPDILFCPDDIGAAEQARLAEAANQVYYIPRENVEWRAQLRETAKILGLQSAAESWIDQYNVKLESARQQINNAQQYTIAVLRLVNEDLYFHSNRNIDTVLFNDLRMQPAYSHNQAVYSVKTTVKQLEEVQPDIIFLMVCQETNTLQYWKKLQDQIDWNNLQAVRGKRVFLIPSDPWKEYSPIGIERTLVQAMQFLQEVRV